MGRSGVPPRSGHRQGGVVVPGARPQKPFDILLRAVASSTCERELEHIRSLASTHDAEQLEQLDRAIVARRRALSGLDRDG